MCGGHNVDIWLTLSLLILLHLLGLNDFLKYLVIFLEASNSFAICSSLLVEKNN